MTIPSILTAGYRPTKPSGRIYARQIERQVYCCPVSHLVPAATVAREIKP